MNPADQADCLMRDILAAVPPGMDRAAVGLALIGAGVLLLERAGDRELAGAVLGPVGRSASALPGDPEAAGSSNIT